MITFVDVEEARQRIQNKIYLSPFPYSETISQIAGSRVFFKLDNLQMTGSFKERGALNRLLTLTQDQAKRGVIAAVRTTMAWPWLSTANDSIQRQPLSCPCTRL